MRFSLLAVFLLIASLPALTGCTNSSKPAQKAIPLSSFLLEFKTEEIRELAISRNEPSLDQAWSTRLTRSGSGSEWTIASAPEGTALLDSLADSAFIEHLLSLLKTFQATGTAPKGPLSSFGLEPPRFAIRGVGTARPLEVRIGLNAPGSPGRYSYLPALSNEEAPSEVVVAQGSALQMLGMIDRFDVLRRRVLSLLAADDVDEIELWKDSSRLFYAQRQGDDWVDAKRKALRVPVQEILDGITHLRVQGFVDDAARAGLIHQELKKAKYRVILKDRSGTPLEIRISPWEGKIYSTASNRPRAAFEMDPASLRYWVTAGARKGGH